ncbi:MAG: HAD family hydrolase [Dehalococcoidia bacterium]|nr:HAD family hydrolase [Dehalococcoidia bacterium]
MKSSLSDIKAISFDVDGTLWDFEDALRRGLEAALREVRVIDPEGTEGLTVDHLDQAWMVERDRQWGTITDLVKLRHDAMRRAFAGIDTPDKDLTNRATDAYLEERNRNSRPFDDVVPGLEALHGMYTLGTLTNGSMRPERLGLEMFFDFIVMSVEHGGIEKPDPRIFEIAVREACCEPHELLHVGDHIEYDVRGANDAGVRSVWLNRIGESSSSDVRPDLEVTSLSELADSLLGIKTH